MRKSQIEKEEKAVKPPRVKKERVPRVKAEKNSGTNLIFRGSIGDFFRNKVVIGFICVLVALLISFVGVPVVQGYVSKRVSVVKVNTDIINQGSQITADMLKISDVAAIDKPANAATSFEQVVGTYAKYDLLLDDTLTAGKLERERPVTHPYLYTLTQGKSAISVSVKGLAEGLSGKLKPGDIVSIYAVFNKSGADEDYSAIQPPELKYVRVLAISNATARDIDLDNIKHVETKNTTADERENLPSTITFLANDLQAASLAGIDHNAIIHVALVSRAEDTDLCDALLAEQEFYLDSLQSADGLTEQTELDGQSAPETGEVPQVNTAPQVNTTPQVIVPVVPPESSSTVQQAVTSKPAESSASSKASGESTASSTSSKDSSASQKESGDKSNG